MVLILKLLELPLVQLENQMIQQSIIIEFKSVFKIQNISSAATISFSLESKFFKRKYEKFTGSGSIFPLNILTITDKKIHSLLRDDISYI